ncbi:D-3-phosphoglycerate dehydrogenase [Lachnospiraceae bacterium YSD2013]|nr:phosphoglycerate dehydrogenase [Lachnospiraceae bacterium]SCX00539.1 D-3-phosphoglycerate dehydrogenase [Lachnospiraceae bacterium YSD2013]
MFKYACLNPIANVGLKNFDENYTKTDDVNDAEGILVRSAVMHEMDFSDKLLAVARAGAGVNNIPLDKLAQKGVVVFNTPGANANGVKELAIAAMLLASRDIIGGIDFVKENKADENIAKLVEKGKSKYAGTEIRGKKLGIIGLGAIGGPLANAARHLGMDVYGCDPYISIDAAWNLSRDIHHVKTREEIFQKCDYISVHVPLIENDDPNVNTKKMINKDTIAMMKKGVIILNLARDLLVDDDAMEEALKSGKVRKYVTDFPNAKTANMEGVIAIPHLGASTEESEDNCAVMAVNQMKNYLENGNIVNSVNYPALDMGICQKAGRIAIFHKNVANMITQFTASFGDLGINVSDMSSKSRGEVAYTMIDVDEPATDAIKAKLEAIDGVFKVRIVK